VNATDRPDAGDLPDGAYIAALAGLEGMGPRRLRQLIAHHRPQEAYHVLLGAVPAHPSVQRMLNDSLRAAWRTALAEIHLGAVWERCERSGVRVLVYGDPEYPAVLLHDPVPPAALFVRGDLSVLDRRRAGIVGTRNATRGGLATAEALGLDLAAVGVAVVSGLATGIDGAAHRGALAGNGAPVAVVGNGPDRPYPRHHGSLWERVVEQGVLISEWPPGVGPDAFRFPMRNRILAALCEVLVVVESRERGGSLLTVREAADRSVTVMAVPGSPHSRASAGTNQLLCEGSPPVTCSDDVLVALGLDTRRTVAAGFDPRPAPRGAEVQVLARCREGPSTLDSIVQEVGLSITDAALALARLERSGWLVESGGWFEVLDPWVTAR
jgi:DNA processing protein